MPMHLTNISPVGVTATTIFLLLLRGLLDSGCESCPAVVTLGSLALLVSAVVGLLPFPADGVCNILPCAFAFRSSPSSTAAAASG
jgi:hypothetical protein